MGYNENDNILEQIVNSLDDLPAPIAGKIYLENKRYLFTNSLVTPYTLVFPSDGICEMASTLIGVSTIVYVGVGNILEGTLNPQALVYINKLSVVAVAGGNIFSISGDSLASLITAEIFCLGGNAIGTINDVRFANHFSFWTGLADGMVLNNCNAVDISQEGAFLGFLNTGGTFITFTGTHAETKITDTQFVVGSTEYALYIDPTATFTLGIVSRCGISDITRFLKPGSKDQTDIYWDYRLNIPFPDSAYLSAMDFQGNITPTTIITANTPVKINAVWTENTDVTERFTFDSSGRLTYVGLEEIKVKITCSFSANFVTPGVVKTMTGYLYKNGLQIARSLSSSSTNANPINLICQSLEKLQTNDYVEIWVENNTNTDNIIVLDGNFDIIRSA